MARASKRRRLWDTYSLPGFRPEPTVRGVFGDPKAVLITLKRRSKKRRAGAAVACRWVGTTAKSVGSAICRAGIRGYFWNWRCGGGGGAAAGRGRGGGRAFFSSTTPSH